MMSLTQMTSPIENIAWPRRRMCANMGSSYFLSVIVTLQTQRSHEQGMILKEALHEEQT